MPYSVLENIYATLDEVEQKEIIDFAYYLFESSGKTHAQF